MNHTSKKFNNFDWEKYISTYSDLSYITNKNLAWYHWNDHGKNENRRFFKLNQDTDKNFVDFDWKTYIENYLDLSHITNKEEAWNHWLNHGKNEGRRITTIYKIERDKYESILKHQENSNTLQNKNNMIFFKKVYDLYGLHYFGWKGAINSFIQYFNNSHLNNVDCKFKNNIFFDEWIEKLLLWGNVIQKEEFLNQINTNNCNLITFMHNPPFLNYYNSIYKKNIANSVIINDECQLNNFLITQIHSNNLINKITFLYVLSNDHKKYIYKNFPQLRNKIVSIHHPIDSLLENDIPFNIDLFLRDKKIYHIGWWLRNFKTFIKFKQPDGYEKVILIKNDFINQWNEISKYHDITNITLRYEIPNEEYVNIFANSCIFIDLEDASANNVILECLKYNTPFITRRMNSIEEYVGRDYPLFFNNKKELSQLNNESKFISLVKEAHNYLINLNKNHVSLETFNKKMIYDIEKLQINESLHKLTWLCIWGNVNIVEATDCINNFLYQENSDNLKLVIIIKSQIHESNIFEYLNNIILQHTNITYYNNFELINHVDFFIENSTTDYLIIVNIYDRHIPIFSLKIINYFNSNPSTDICISNYILINRYFTEYNNELIMSDFSKFLKKNKLFFINELFENKLPNSSFAWRKNIHNLLGNFDNNYLNFMVKCVKNNLNINCISQKKMYLTLNI